VENKVRAQKNTEYTTVKTKLKNIVKHKGRLKCRYAFINLLQIQFATNFVTPQQQGN
jgi:hypothetical protein